MPPRAATMQERGPCWCTDLREGERRVCAWDRGGVHARVLVARRRGVSARRRGCFEEMMWCAYRRRSEGP